ncbi:heterotetrameric sarcosine oxidase gamma subunit [Rhizobium sp. BK512]|jgi:heterotetrameric sarcosine oxidase gamma subunit|uniref:hypothetical protein n=1 Tax=Rhizobium sp. BK512 TaxID=2587010 RepID=UPI0017B715FD|nr:hypothetical protein [Rhizobium sp. BK512]MBB3562642.1 heterotetrameric sarcosine oxidase gamma subunit [Rhizobium sp. BK512]
MAASASLFPVPALQTCSLRERQSISMPPRSLFAVALFGHVSVHLTRTQTTRFELTVLRSFAEDLYEMLEHAAAA